MESHDRVFFPAPADNTMRKIWDICFGSVNRRLQLSDKICGKHFHKSDIVYVSKAKLKIVECITMVNSGFVARSFIFKCIFLADFKSDLPLPVAAEVFEISIF